MSSSRASVHDENSSSSLSSVEEDSGFSLCTILALVGVGAGVLATTLIVILCCVCKDPSPELPTSTCKAYALEKQLSCPADKSQLLEQTKCLLVEDEGANSSESKPGLKQCEDFENVCCAAAGSSEPAETTGETVCTAVPQVLPAVGWTPTFAPAGSLEGSIQRSALYPEMFASIQKAVQDKVEWICR